MQMIIAPAKKMVVDTDSFTATALPQFLPATRQLLAAMRTLTLGQAQTMWRCSDKLAQQAYRQLQELDLENAATPAVFGFSGIQYQYMAPDLLTAPALRYLQTNLRILSGFYGVLRPFDAIVPYRLEMQSRLPLPGAKDLYAFWGSRLHDALDFSQPVLNLASKEYSKAITNYLQPGEQLTEIVFGQVVDGKFKTRATQAKMARGAMVRYLAENQINTLSGVCQFDHPQYRFDEARSTATKLVFCRRDS
ncbi:peroxide stress protein YaaA [Lacticaseibacillus hulanensis]|uniref:peroxide stress protein YaaA n=1 Tax=Lacticaseibacillus hulanensis TaxID=2493111 RepID=UPI000FD78B2B|nr:peroxide stress protein YaaA [Lacticaseibacillus hulanensis]